MLVDLVWSKDKILETYFNIAEWGRAHSGDEAGARRARKIRRPLLRSRGRASDRDAAQSAHPRRQTPERARSLQSRRDHPTRGAVSGTGGLHRDGEVRLTRRRA